MLNKYTEKEQLILKQYKNGPYYTNDELIKIKYDGFLDLDFRHIKETFNNDK